MFYFFGHKTVGILALQLGIEAAGPALGGEVLTGLSEKSRDSLLKWQIHDHVSCECVIPLTAELISVCGSQPEREQGTCVFFVLGHTHEPSPSTLPLPPRSLPFLLL